MLNISVGTMLGVSNENGVTLLNVEVCVISGVDVGVRMPLKVGVKVKVKVGVTGVKVG